MGNEEMKALLLRNMLNKPNDKEEREKYNYIDTIQNVKTVLSNEASGESGLLERRDDFKVEFSIMQDNLLISVAIDEPLHSLLIELNPLIPCSDVEANYFMFYSILSTPYFGSVDFEAKYRILKLRTEVSFYDEAVSESSFYQILDNLKKEVSQIRGHISDISGKVDSCYFDDYDELIYIFDRDSDQSEKCAYNHAAANTIERTFTSLHSTYYAQTSSEPGNLPTEWHAYVNRLGSKFRSTITLCPEGILRIAVYYASPVKGKYFRQAARYCCNWASNLKTGHITFDRNLGFGIYIDQYLHAPLSEKVVRSILNRCIQELAEIDEALHNNANGILKCMYESEDKSITIEDLETLRHLISCVTEEAVDSANEERAENPDARPSIPKWIFSDEEAI